MSGRADIVAWLDSRLPKQALITIPELIVALGDPTLTSDTVDGWITSGEIDAIDFGTTKKHYWRMSRVSILDFAARRSMGTRAPAERRLPRSGELFPDHPFNERKRDDENDEDDGLAGAVARE